MHRGRKILLAALAFVASGLGACNMVVTKTPLFSEADASALHLRDGVWRPVEAKCAFDDAKPVDAWPECVDPILIRRGEFLSWQRDSKTWKSDDTGKVLIVAGEPLILQLRDKPADSEPFYVYLGVAPKADAQGRIVEFQAWPVLCGQPRPAAKDGLTAPTGSGPVQPFPGLVMDEKGQNCTTADPAALRGAASKSRAIAERDMPTVRWVRDGER